MIAPWFQMLALRIGPVLLGAAVVPAAPPAFAQGAEVGVPQISQYVRRLFQSRDGSIWMGTNDDGAVRFDGLTLTDLSVPQGLAGAAVRGFVEDGDGSIWIATDGGVSRLREGSITSFTTAEGLSDNDCWSILRDRRGTLWVGTRGGACRMEGGRFVPNPLPRAEVAVPSSRFTPTLVWAMAEDAGGDLWFATDGEGVRRLHDGGITTYTSRDGLAGDNVISLAADRAGGMWMGAWEGGASRWDGRGFRTLTNADGLKSGPVWTILEDREGGIWLSVLGEGAGRFDGTRITWFGPAQGLEPRHVQSLLEDRAGRIWAGCSGGLYRREGARFINVTRDGPWPPPAEMEGFSRLAPARWRREVASGAVTEECEWGPGRRSVRMFTVEPGGDPGWQDLHVHYWHPLAREIRVWTVSSFDRGVGEGTLAFSGGNARADLTMHQGRATRRLSTRWTFTGDDAFLSELLEDSGDGAGYAPLAAWKYLRLPAGGAGPAARTPAAANSRLSERLTALEPLLGEWRVTAAGPVPGVPGAPGANAGAGTARAGAAGAGPTAPQAFEGRITARSVPGTEAIEVRVSKGADGAGLSVLDAYVYSHTGRGALRCLALCADGTVCEGGVEVLSGGAIRLRLDATGPASPSPTSRAIIVDLTPAADGSVQGAVRADATGGADATGAAGATGAADDARAAAAAAPPILTFTARREAPPGP